MVGLLYVSTVLVAAGVILIWGVDGSVRSINVNTIGGIVLLAGLVGALVTLVVRTKRDGSSLSSDDESRAFRR